MFILSLNVIFRALIVVLTLSLISYVQFEKVYWIVVSATLALILATIFIQSRIKKSAPKSMCYTAIILVLAIYFCLLSLFSINNIGIDLQTKIYAFLKNTTLPYLAYKIFIPFILLFLLFETADRPKSSGSEARYFPDLVRFIVSGLSLIIPILLFLSYGFDLPLTGALATSGLLTAIIGLALQGNLSNITSGVFLTMEKPFEMDDWITFDGQVGQVKDISWRTTRLRAYDNTEIFVPNEKLAQSTVFNLNKNDKDFCAGGFLTYDSIFVHPRHEPHFVIELLRDALAKARPKDGRASFFEFTGVWFSGAKENGLEFLIAFDTIDRTYLFDNRSSVMLSINYVFTRAGITMTSGNLLQNLKPDANLALVQDYSQDYSNYIFDNYQENNIYLEAQNKEIWFRRLSLFASLKHRDFKLLAKEAQKRTFDIGEIIVQQGEVGASMFIIVEGVVKVALENPDNTSSVLATLTVSEVFGEMSLLTGAERTATVSATRPVVVFEIKKPTFAKIIKNNPDVLNALSSILAKRQQGIEAVKKINSKSENDDTGDADIFSNIKNAIVTFFALPKRRANVNRRVTKKSK